ncbi:hypothetical protein CCUS01_16303 [Colletotrichum cuscutae]|uniref:Uncharacterized protein n=1 Tax=Colletotrichum cuscutae TaxID=1209917 RepID=A0AAI9VFJ1_9PEZI|nr:hypothetical protein CCUS01_16303 [Colletotrichum cuscutae]
MLFVLVMCVKEMLLLLLLSSLLLEMLFVFLLLLVCVCRRWQVPCLLMLTLRAARELSVLFVDSGTLNNMQS